MLLYIHLNGFFCRTLCSDVNQLLWVGWPHMVTVFSAFLQLHAGPTPPPWLHAGHMPSVWTVSKWLHMHSVWPQGSVCRSPLTPNQKQEPARSGPVGGGLEVSRQVTHWLSSAQSLISNKPGFDIKARDLYEGGHPHHPVINIYTRNENIVCIW